MLQLAKQRDLSQRRERHSLTLEALASKLDAFEGHALATGLVDRRVNAAIGALAELVALAEVRHGAA